MYAASNVRISSAVIFLRAIERIGVTISETAGGRCLALLVGVEAAVSEGVHVVVAFDAVRIVSSLRD